MPLTIEQLQAIYPQARAKAGFFIDPLNQAMAEFAINTPTRMAAFLAQVGHESGQLRYVRELGSDTYLAKYDTGPLAKALGNTPAADGDGQRYRGRGLIQITGRANYQAVGTALGLDLVNSPALLEQPINACRSAAWFWSKHGLNELADLGRFDDITRRINGGQNGREERRALWATALTVLGENHA